MDSMDIRALSEATGLKVRQIRYVLDHELIPVDLIDEGYETTKQIRVFAPYQGVHIASAAALLSVGLRSESIKRLFQNLARIYPDRPSKFRMPILNAVATTTDDAKAQVADGQYVRWILMGQPGPWYDTLDPSLPKISEIRSVVIVEINMGEITRLIRQFEKSA